MRSGVARAPREQIDDAAHGAGAVERGGGALDHFDLAEIHRRNLQQPQAARLLAEQRQPVGEEARVAAAHSLDAHAGRAERRRRRLHAQTAHLVQHHDDVAGRHEHLLFDFLTPEHIDARRLILEPAASPRGRDDGDFFFDVGRRYQLDLHGMCLTGDDGQGRGGLHEAVFGRRDLDRPGRDRQRRHAIRARRRDGGSGRHRGAGDGFGVSRSDFDTDGAGLLAEQGERQVEREHQIIVPYTRASATAATLACGRHQS